MGLGIVGVSAFSFCGGGREVQERRGMVVECGGFCGFLVLEALIPTENGEFCWGGGCVRADCRGWKFLRGFGWTGFGVVCGSSLGSLCCGRACFW